MFTFSKFKNMVCDLSNTENNIMATFNYFREMLWDLKTYQLIDRKMYDTCYEWLKEYALTFDIDL